MKKLLFILATVALLFAMVACSETPVYVVSFDTGYADVSVNAQLVREGSNAKSPYVACEYLAFDGWYADAGLNTKFDFSAPIKDNTTVYAKWNTDFVAFLSDKAFDIDINTDAYDGDLYFSWDGYEWYSYDNHRIMYSRSTVEAKNIFDDNRYNLYFRGVDNKVLSYEVKESPAVSEAHAWKINVANEGDKVYCSGNILALLDYTKFNVETIVFDDHAFDSMFKDQTALASIPNISSVGCYTEDCFKDTFKGCNLIAVTTATPDAKSFVCLTDQPDKYLSGMFGNNNGVSFIYDTTYYVVSGNQGQPD